VQLILGWPPDSTFARDTAIGVMNLCADIMRHDMLRGVIAALPANKAERANLFALAASLRRAGAPPLALLCDVRSLAAENLDECLDVGILDFVFVDDAVSPHHAVELVSASLLAETADARVCLWLGDNCTGHFQQHLAAWVSAFPFSVKLGRAPFGPMPSAPSPIAGPGANGGPPAHCAWLNSVVTVVGGRVIPCPAYGILTVNTPLGKLEEVQKIRETWKEGLGHAEPCRRCARSARFQVPHWPDGRNSRAKTVPEITYHDHVGGDAHSLGASELARHIGAFARRVAASAKRDQAP
jgi:hypothetical protein